MHLDKCMHLHGCIVNLYTALVQWTCMELHGIQVCGVECHALVVNSVHFSSALKTTPSSSGWSRHAPSLQNEITFFPVRCMAFTFQPHEISQVFDAPEFESHDMCEVFLRGWVSTSRNSSPTLFARFSRNSSPTIFAMVSTSRNSSPTIFARFSCEVLDAPEFKSHDICEVFDAPEFESHDICDGFDIPEFESHDTCEGFDIPEFESHDICEVFNEKGQKHPRVFTRAEVRYHVICGVFKRPNVRYRAICGVFMHPDVRYHAICGVFKRPDVRYHAICGVFMRPGCPRRTTSLLQKVDFPATEAPRVRGVLRMCVLQKSTFQPRKLRASVCATKLDFPATEAPGAPGVLRLYYKSRLSSHGSSGCPRRTTSVLKNRLSSHGSSGGVRSVLHLYDKTRFSSHGSPRRTTSVLHKSKKTRNNTTVLAPRPRENPQRGYVCMSRNAKTRRFWHRANAETRRGVTFVCQETQKHDGFGTAPTPKPAEGVRAREKKYQTRRF